jgi:hypothetical protein
LGYERIRGELLILGHRVSSTSIRNLIRRRRIPSAPRRVGLTWRRFLQAHGRAILACDYFTVDTVFLKRLYVLFFLELASRRITRPDTVLVARQSACAWRRPRMAGWSSRLSTRDPGSRCRNMSGSLSAFTVGTTPAEPRERASAFPSAGRLPAATEATSSFGAYRGRGALSSSACCGRPRWRPHYCQLRPRPCCPEPPDHLDFDQIVTEWLED